MSANVVLGLRIENTDVKRVSVNNLDLNCKVSVLRERASESAAKPADELELVYAGVVLDDDNTLSYYGVKSGRTIHVLDRILPPSPKPPRQITDAELQRFLFAFEEYGHRNILQKFSRQDVMDKIIASAPDLIADPAAIALLQDPELLLLFAEPDILRKILDSHPLLVDALTQIMNYLRENPNTLNSNQATTSTGYSYSLEALSDDEDMDSNDTQPREGHPLTRNASYNAITAAQLAAAIANATTTFSSTGAVVNNTPPPTSGSNIITNEMFGNALQQAFATATSGSTTSSSTTTPSATLPNGDENAESTRARLQPQLQQMRDMGLMNEAQNIRALEVTSGDVQAAIELVFNGDMDMSF